MPSTVLPGSDYKDSQMLFQSGSNLYHNPTLLTRNQAQSQHDGLRHSKSKNYMATGYSVIDMSLSSNHPRKSSRKKKDKKKHRHRNKSKHSAHSQSSAKSASRKRTHKKSKKGKEMLELSHHHHGPEKRLGPQTTKNHRKSSIAPSTNGGGKVHIFNI